MTVPEAATALGIGRSAGYEAARRGELPTIRIGRRVLVPVVALEKILAEAHGDPKEGECGARTVRLVRECPPTGNL